MVTPASLRHGRGREIDQANYDESKAGSMSMNASGIVVIDCKQRAFVHHHVVAAGNCTLQFENVRNLSAIYLMTQQDATGGWTIDFNGTEFPTPKPVQTTSPNAMDTWILGAMERMMVGMRFHVHSFQKDVKVH